MVRPKSLNQGVINLDTTHNETQIGEQSQVKLPKIHIPSFSGDYSEWQESSSLNPVQKFQYLKGLLPGEAAVLLRHIAVTESNYISALNKLKERYDRKKHIISTFIRTFVEQPSVHNATAANIKRLMDTSDEVIRGLQALGKVGETRDPWLIYILLQKLDDKSKAAWAEHSADTINPEFSEFLKFLSRRIDTLESLISSSKRSIPKAEVRGHVVSEDIDGEIGGHAAFKSFNYQCAMCQEEGHSLFQCDVDVSDAVKNTIQKHDSTQDTKTAVSEVINGHSQNTSICAILPTAIVDAVNQSGRTTPRRALLDSGSQASFITESCAQRLQLERRNARVSVSGLGQTSSGTSKGLVTVTLKPKLFPEFSIEALVMSKITGKLPPQKLDVNIKPYAGIKLADPQFDQTGSIDILIGADHFFNILQSGQIKSGSNEPILQNTVFGWIVSGQPGISKDSDLVSMLALPNQRNEMVDIDRSLRRFWEIESLNDPKNILSPEGTLCENHFVKHVERNSQGRLIVKLPFKKSPNHLGESLPAAVQRLRGVERRFIRDPTYAKLYRDFMAEYQQLNHMVEVPPPKPTEVHFYLPHHGVLKTTNNITKMRVVFDGSSKSSTNVSLNDCLAVGPTVQSSLYAIILRFREHKIAFSADVEKMYRQVTISPEDTRYQRIVWRPDPSQPIRHFQLQTVTYGLTSASFLATRALKKMADDNKNVSLHASQVISKDVYVDGLMTGADHEDEALQLKKKVTEILSSYGFHLRKWKSNSMGVLRDIPHELQEADNKEIQDHNQQLIESVKVLGINWNPKTDSFTFTAQVPDYTNFTKRTVLSEASRLFDLLGWLSPVVIAFKIFLQMLWGDNLEWDDPLPADKLILWNLSTQQPVPKLIYMAYAAVVYFLITSPNGNMYSKLISAKTKVAPIKQQTLPRLELCAAVLLTNLIKVVKGESNQDITELYAWTDSQIVLDWLGSCPRRWSTFVGNRTSEILSTLSRNNWRHVPSADNPADCASRGLSSSELNSHALWWNGPNWLVLPPELWPPQLRNYGHFEEKSNKTTAFTLTCTKSNEWFDKMILKYSSFRKLQRVMCYILRFVGNTRKAKEHRVGGVYLRREELLHVVHIICYYEQGQFYKDEILALQSKQEVSRTSSLKSLDPFIDDIGLLRVGGRLQNSNAPYCMKHPIIIHPKSTITLLILRDIHLDNKHAGASLLLSITRQEYWVPNGKIKAKEVIRKCVTCTKFKADLQQQLMGSLPSSRVELVRPFLKTGVDYAGPISIHLVKGRGQKTYKAYICLFICLSTKAVHLELVNDLSSDAFLGALKRFTARRGVCRELHSDNGTNFVGADSKLHEVFTKLIKESNNISDYFSRYRITRNFIPPNSPHFGGLWEAAIKSTKFHIRRVIGTNILTQEEMSTLLAEIEGILNSRPLCAVNDTEVDPLTRSHFLIGHPHIKIPERDITHLKETYLSRWQMVQQMSQHFWKRWYIEYLTSLQQRTKWRTRTSPIQIDDIVLIKDKNLPVNQWLLGKVMELHPGSDGLVRVVTLKTRNSDFKRPIHKLCLLPISRENSLDE